LGSAQFNYGSKYGLKSMTIVMTATGDRTVSLAEFPPDSASGNESIQAALQKQTALDLKLKLDEIWLDASKEELAAQREVMLKLRESRKDVPQFQEVSALPSEQLYTLHPVSDPGYNRLVGDEVMWREINKRINI